MLFYNFLRMPHLMSHKYFIVDPRVDNHLAIFFFHDLGFVKHKEVQMKNAMGEDNSYLLMVKKRAH